MKIFITNNSSETQKLGVEFARSRLARLKCTPIALYGELGSGKTTFVQGLAKGLGIKRRIISPTFIIIRSYNIKNSRGAGSRSARQNSKFFYHVDLYRVVNEKGIEGLGLEEIIKNRENIVAVEWAEKMGGLLPKKRWDVRFEYVGENKRRIAIEKFKARNPKSETISKFK